MIDRSISKSVKLASFTFPNRSDYEEYFIRTGAIKNAEDLWNNEQLVKLVHMHWHGEGQNGCIFALLAARKSSEVGWHSHVFHDKIEALESNNLKTEIKNVISNAISDNSCEIISLLYTSITSEEDLVRLVKSLMTIDIIKTVENTKVDGNIVLALRVAVDQKQTLSWLMSFGPFSFYPNTRQSPLTEIAIRVKPKPNIQFHKLSKDTDAAHLADLPLEYSQGIMEKTWDNTYRRTRLILGEEPTIFSAAKTTFTFPQELWEE